jgi:hypothetical protein
VATETRRLTEWLAIGQSGHQCQCRTHCPVTSNLTAEGPYGDKSKNVLRRYFLSSFPNWARADVPVGGGVNAREIPETLFLCPFNTQQGQPSQVLRLSIQVPQDRLRFGRQGRQEHSVLHRVAKLTIQRILPKRREWECGFIIQGYLIVSRGIVVCRYSSQSTPYQ